MLVAVAARSLGDVAEEVTLTQYRTLVVLASRGPQSLAELAEAVDVTPPTATRMCDRLIKKGLIVRRHERGDRRLIRLTLAKDGRKLVDAGNPAKAHGDLPSHGSDPTWISKRHWSIRSNDLRPLPVKFQNKIGRLDGISK